MKTRDETSAHCSGSVRAEGRAGERGASVACIACRRPLPARTDGSVGCDDCAGVLRALAS